MAYLTYSILSPFYSVVSSYWHLTMIYKMVRLILEVATFVIFQWWFLLSKLLYVCIW